MWEWALLKRRRFDCLGWREHSIISRFLLPNLFILLGLILRFIFSWFLWFRWIFFLWIFIVEDWHLSFYIGVNVNRWWLLIVLRKSNSSKDFLHLFVTKQLFSSSIFVFVHSTLQFFKIFWIRSDLNPEYFKNSKAVPIGIADVFFGSRKGRLDYRKLNKGNITHSLLR